LSISTNAHICIAAARDDTDRGLWTSNKQVHGSKTSLLHTKEGKSVWPRHRQQKCQLASHYKNAHRIEERNPSANLPPNQNPHCHSQVRVAILTPFRKQSPEESTKERRVVGICARFRPVTSTRRRRRDSTSFPRRRAYRCPSLSPLVLVVVGSCARQRLARCMRRCSCLFCRPV
jgi:hypothetical protein